MSNEGSNFDNSQEEQNEVIVENEVESEGFLDKLGSSKIGRAIVAAAAIGGAGALVGKAIEETNQVEAPHYVYVAAGGNHDIYNTAQKQEAAASHNEQLSSAVESGLHKYFPNLDLTKIKISKERKDDGYSYVFSDESGRTGVLAISANGVRVGLERAYEFDNGAINFGSTEGEVMTMKGVSDGLQSIPAHK